MSAFLIIIKGFDGAKTEPSEALGATQILKECCFLNYCSPYLQPSFTGPERWSVGETEIWPGGCMKGKHLAT